MQGPTTGVWCCVFRSECDVSADHRGVPGAFAADAGVRADEDQERGHRRSAEKQQLGLPELRGEEADHRLVALALRFPARGEQHEGDQGWRRDCHCR